MAAKYRLYIITVNWKICKFSGAMVSGSLLLTRLAMWKGAKDQVAYAFFTLKLKKIHNIRRYLALQHSCLLDIKYIYFAVRGLKIIVFGICIAFQHSYLPWEPLWMTITLLQVMQFLHFSFMIKGFKKEEVWFWQNRCLNTFEISNLYLMWCSAYNKYIFLSKIISPGPSDYSDVAELVPDHKASLPVHQ